MLKVRMFMSSFGLMASGIQKPRDHILLLKLQYADDPLRTGPDGAVTLLVSKTPFTKADLQELQGVASRMQFDFLVTPEQAANADFAQLASGQDLAGFTRRFPINITSLCSRL